MRAALACVLLLFVAFLAGCAQVAQTPTKFTTGYPRYEEANGLYHFEFTTGSDKLVHADFAPGAVGKVWNKGTTPFHVTFPPHALLLENGNTSIALPTADQTIAPGARQYWLAAPSTQIAELQVDGTSFRLDPLTAAGYQKSTTQILSGENAYALEQIQEAQFPHRTPGMPNYAASQQYFKTYFEGLGYSVEVDPFGTDGLPCPPAAVPVRTCLSAVANIVATKPGRSAKTLFVAGGHYDMVPATTHAAFDDTSGVVTTMELARVLAPFQLEHTLKFALWGGEESGTLGSEFWVHTHPEAVANVETYWNLDVVGMSWPAPVLRKSPVVIAAGPDLPSSGQDGSTSDPISQSLLGWARLLQKEWLGYPDQVDGQPMFRYEGVESGEFAGGYAGVNDQSDHASFTKVGIPAYFIFNGDTLKENNPVGIHSNKDTLDNITKVAYYGKDANLDEPLDAAIFPIAKAALVESWEATMFFPFYATVLQDLGVYSPPAPAAVLPLGIPPAASFT